MNRKNIFFCGGTAVLTLLLAGGCSTIRNAHLQKADMMTALTAGDNPAVQQKIDSKLSPPAWYNSSVINTGDELHWRLEAGSMSFHTGDFRRTLHEFRTAEKLIKDHDERAQISVRNAGAESAMLFTNLNALPYRGFCRDRIMIAVFKSLAYLGNQDEPAFRAQLRRLRAEQKKVQEDYRKFFEQEKQAARAAKKEHGDITGKAADAAGCVQHPERTKSKEFADSMKELQAAAKRGSGNFLNPAALFLSGLGSARDGSFDNACIDFRRLYEAMPENPLVRQLYVTMLYKTGRPVPPRLRQTAPLNFPPERNAVYLLCGTGIGAALKQVAIYFPIECAWPVCEFHPDPFTSVTFSAGKRSGKAVKLADMDAVWAQEFQERMPGIITRIVLSTLVKEGLYYGGATAIFVSNMSGTAMAIAGTCLLIVGLIYRTAMNTADTRSWEILPKTISLAVFPMPKDRKAVIRLNGGITQTVTLPPACRSAVIYVSAPSLHNIRYHVLPLNNQ